MAKGEDITTKFKVDVSDLKRGITEANKSIKLANAEFKAASAGMDDWAKSTDGIEAKLKQLNTVLDNENKKLKSYKDQLEEQKSAYTENGKRADELKAKLQQLSNQGVSKTSEEYKKYEKALTDCEKEQTANGNAIDKLKVTILNQQAAVNKTEKEIRNYNTALDDLKSESAQADSASENVANGLRDVGNAADDADDGVKKLDGGFTVLKGALAGLVASGIRTAINGIQNLVGEAITGSDALYKFGQTMGFAGYDDSTIKKATKDMKDYADKTVYDLETISNTTAQLAANGVKDFTGLTQAAGNLNAVAGGNAETFKSVGMVMTQTAGAGKLTTENWNQLVDAIPGASGKLQEAMLKAGAYTGNFREAMEKGQITSDEFNAAIMELGNEPVAVEAAQSVETFEGAVGNMQAAVVNGLMEIIDAIGMENITGFINGVTAGIQKVIPIIKGAVGFVVSNGKVVIGILSGIVAAFAVGKVISGITTFTNALAVMRGAVEATAVSQKALTLANNMSTLSLIKDKVATIASTVATKAMALASKAAAAAQWLLNAALNANPIMLIVTVIGLLVAAFITLWKKSEAFREFWIGLWNKIEAVAEPIIKGLVEWFSNAWELIKGVWSAVVGFFSGIWNGIKSVFSVVGNWFKEKFEAARDFVKAAWSGIKGFFGTVWSGIKSVFSAVGGWFKEKFENARENVKAAWSGIKGFFGTVWTGIKGVFSGIGGWFKEKFTNARENVKAAWSTAKNIFSNAYTNIKSVFSDVGGWFKEKFSGARDNVKSAFSNLPSFFSGLWDKIKSSFSSLGTKIGSAIGSAAKSGINKVISGAESVINKGIGLINGAIGLINKLPGVKVGKVSKVNFPRLAQGGVLAKGQVGLLEGSGAEAVVPLDQNKKWIRKVADDLRTELAVSGQRAGAVGVGSNVNNFTQIINAPKTPSRIELYRDARNLLAYSKGGF